MFNLECFINEFVTKRHRSLLADDILQNEHRLQQGVLGKEVLVIGGAGSIGSSFIKSILRYHPKSLVVVDINENGLAELTRDLRSTKEIEVPNDYITYPIDYSSSIFKKIYRKRKGFDIVANFSAHKHVRSEKDIYCIEAMLRNNLIHAKYLLDTLAEYPPETYFCVSTDKAANPVNVMGASKRIMEDLIFAYSDKFPVKTARFANVAFSDGSLPAGFLLRMQKKQPICAPTDVKRFFVSPTESGQICMLACILGENREIYFPKLEQEKMLTFDQIAIDFVRENGYQVCYCKSEEEAVEKMQNSDTSSNIYPVYFSESDTSGEKHYEEFYTEDENVDLEKLKALGVIIDKQISDRKEIECLIADLLQIFEQNNVTKKMIVDRLQKYLPSFHHIETGKSLDSKM